MKLAGHTKQIRFLEKSIETGKLPHGLIFAGPQYVGKRSLARYFAQKLLCEKNSNCNECGQCKTMVSEANADYISLGSDEAIKIEQVRELIYKLSLKPYMAKYKIAVIDNAENMTVEAQNSLLKVLEEPKSYTIIILITANPGKLLRTISSRAQKINFGLVSTTDYQHLISDKLDKEAQNLVTVLAAGRPGLAVRISQDEELVTKLIQTSEDYGIIESRDLASKLKLAAELADLETHELRQVLDFWLIKSESGLAANPTMAAAQNLRQINSARKFLDQNVNSKLLLTNLMLNLS